MTSIVVGVTGSVLNNSPDIFNLLIVTRLAHLSAYLEMVLLTGCLPGKTLDCEGGTAGNGLRATFRFFSIGLGFTELEFKVADCDSD